MGKLWGNIWVKIPQKTTIYPFSTLFLYSSESPYSSAFPTIHRRCACAMVVIPLGFGGFFGLYTIHRHCGGFDFVYGETHFSSAARSRVEFGLSVRSAWVSRYVASRKSLRACSSSARMVLTSSSSSFRVWRRSSTRRTRWA